ncbi:MAG: 3-deoxy-manno-octulosonate cytidylyltransferase [Bacteroidota bacterium]
MQCIGIIPARYASTRFPGKPLVDIQGKSMIQRVYEQACKCPSLEEVVVATDDNRIFDHVSAFGHAVMTDTELSSGTERCLQALKSLNNHTNIDAVINIQGDEPFISPEQIELVIKGLHESGKTIVTLVKKIDDRELVNNPHIVKVVFSRRGRALYFSRAPIPHLSRQSLTDIQNNHPVHYKHLGLYGYHVNSLEKIVALPPGLLEKVESLEQLRWLEHNFDIYVKETTIENIAIDTPEDLNNIPPADA